METIGNLTKVSEDLAKGLALRHRLVDEEGHIWCWQCNQREALLPSLHCPACLAAAWSRRGIVMPYCVNRAQTDADYLELASGG